MRPVLSYRFCLLLLCIAVLWFLCGSPLSASEWQSVPDYWLLQWRQLPERARHMLQYWTISSASAQTRDCGLTLSLYRCKSDTVQIIGLEDYIQGCVSAEMPASYAHDALCSQAIAARTYAVSSCITLGGSGCNAHPESDLCDNSACCQGYLDAQEQRVKWNDQYMTMSSRVSAAVRCTAGIVLTCDGMPIEALYHACSGGMTEDAATVFSQGRSYLVSVASPGEEHYSQFRSETVLSRQEAAERLRAAFPGCGVTAEGLPGQLRIQSSTSSGRIETILVGTKTVTGAAFRQALGLHSTLCTWDYTEQHIRLTVKGYGHGVGMSQAGAQAMASTGCSYREILQHYYTGAHLSLLPDLHDVHPLRTQ